MGQHGLHDQTLNGPDELGGCSAGFNVWRNFATGFALVKAPCVVMSLGFFEPAKEITASTLTARRASAGSFEAVIKGGT